VGARKLIDILRTCRPTSRQPGIVASAEQAHLQGGKSRFTLQTLPAEDFPLVQEAADFGPASACRRRRSKT
jgi:DNA polymerase-3 subunit beta